MAIGLWSKGLLKISGVAEIPQMPKTIVYLPEKPHDPMQALPVCPYTVCIVRHICTVTIYLAENPRK